MLNLYEETEFLDRIAIDELGLNSEILMENAAFAIAKRVRKELKKGSKVLLFCGSGNNGADGVAALRMLSKEYKTYCYLCFDKLSPMLQKQLLIAQKAGVVVTKEKIEAKCYLDGIFGSGLNRDIGQNIVEIIEWINGKKGLKIAIDLPSGLGRNTTIKADFTIAMGGIKLLCLSDFAKDFVGKIEVANLGVDKSLYQKESDYKLVRKKDLELVKREQNTNKSDFGRVNVVMGRMSGAAILSALAAQTMGAGLVSIVSKERVSVPPTIMTKENIEDDAVIVVGPGFVDEFKEFDKLTKKSVVIDAGLCYNSATIEFLKNNTNTVITPHPKEFVSLLSLSRLAHIDVATLQKERFKFAKMWSLEFGGVLVLKGANTIVAKEGKLFVVSCGTPKLAKGGSGDVLTGVIAALIAQKQNLLKASINGVLAHGLSAKKSKVNDYAFDSMELIKGLKWL